MEFLTRIFETDESEKVQAVICTGLAKLMLSGMISDEKARRTLEEQRKNCVECAERMMHVSDTS